MSQPKSFAISKRTVWESYKRVKANRGAAGVDGQTITEFERDLSGNLYKLWNRLASGSYMPPAVRRVEIPKASGGTRPLGIPTVADRIAQMVVKDALEPILEPCFHADSYGYRPHRSAHDALEVQVTAGNICGGNAGGTAECAHRLEVKACDQHRIEQRSDAAPSSRAASGKWCRRPWRQNPMAPRRGRFALSARPCSRV
jgi:hypothetical protein